VTCIVDQLMPDIGVATARLLKRAGVTVDFPAAQTCCGQPFFNSGFRKEAKRLAKRTVAILDPYEAVVVPSGSCASMIRVEYPHLLQDSPRWHYPAKRVAEKTYELSQFLAHQAGWPQHAPLAQDAGKRALPVTYHDSCHMCRLLKLKEEPRQLLEGTGHKVTEMDESDRCCGFGGLFSVRMPELSNAITAEKLRQANDTEAAVLVTADPGCLMQMRGMVADGELSIEHIATLLEEATR
jgi:L-lactate dehydrogenase complex protein LldE